MIRQLICLSSALLIHTTVHALVIPTNTGQLEAITISNVNGTFQTIALENTYVSPVVVCTHNLASSANNPAVVRIRNAAASSFEILLQEPPMSTDVTPATVHCLIAEEGANQLTDGRNFEAHTVISDDIAGGNPGRVWNGRGEHVSAALVNTYTSPVVLGQVMTFNDPDFSSFWSYDCEDHRNPPFDSGFSDGLCVGKHVGEDTDLTRNNETLGYFVIEANGSRQGDSSGVKYETSLGSDTIFGVGNTGTISPPYSYTLSDTYSFGVATIEAMDGTDGGLTTIFGPDPFANNQIDLAFDEDQISNAERARIDDQAGFWVFKESDFGDAPDSYSTLDGSGGPEHLILSRFTTANDDIFIGSSATADSDGTPGTLANTDTDDGNITFPNTPDLSPGDSYTIDVPYTGNARLCGWVDFDTAGQTGDGSFEADERSCVNTSTCSGSGVSGICSLTFTVPADFARNQAEPSYARFRIGPTASEVESPTGLARGGEVEDHMIPADSLPVTLSSLSSHRHGHRLDVRWQSSSELFNVGYQLWGQGADGQWQRLNRWLLRSRQGNSVEPQSYRLRLTLPRQQRSITALGISSVDSDGTEHYYGPFTIGQSYGDLSDLEPINWNHIRAEVDAQMKSAGYVRSGRGYRKAAVRAAAPDTAEVVEFSVPRTGLYRVTGQSLLAQGIDLTAVAQGRLAVLDAQGRPVARHIVPKGTGRGYHRTLGRQGEILFYAQVPSSGAMSLYSDELRYRLVIDPTQVRSMQVQRRQRLRGELTDDYQAYSRYEHDRAYSLTSESSDPWIDRHLISENGRAATYAVRLAVEPDANWSAGYELELGLGKASSEGREGEHVAEGLVLGTEGVLSLGTSVSEGTGEWVVRFSGSDEPKDMGDSQILAGGRFKSGHGARLSWLNADWVGVYYQRPLVAKAGENHLQFTHVAGARGYEVVVPEVGGVRIYASDGQNVVVIAPESQQRYRSEGRYLRRVKFAALGGASLSSRPIRYWVSAPRAAYSVKSVESKQIRSQSSLLAQAAGSDYLLIAHPAFMGDFDGVNPLASYQSFKAGQGHRVALVNYLEVVDSFGHGQPGPEGLSAYLKAVEAQGDIKNVLLVGGSTYDHTDKLGSGAITFIPSHYGRSHYSKFTSSDAPYVMDEDGDLFANIGRWPVRTGSDLATIIAKSQRWSETERRGEALLISEHTVAGENIDFRAALSGVAGVLPEHWDQSHIAVDEILASNEGMSLNQALAEAKGEIIEQLSAHPDVVLYNGHASTSQLSNKGLFKAGDVSQVTPEGGEMWIPMACYMTYYESTSVNTLAHQLLFRGNAVNISGATLLSSQHGNLRMGTAILDGTLHQGQSIGEAVTAGKAQSNNAGLNINWALLGDPTNRVQ